MADAPQTNQTPTPPPETPAAPPAPKTEQDIIQAAIAAADAAVADPASAPEQKEPAAEPPKVEVRDTDDAEEGDQRQSQWLGELARRDRSLREQARALKAREAELASVAEKAAAYDKREQSLREEITADPLGALKKNFGLDFIDILGRIGPDGTPAKQQDPVVAELRQRLDALEKQRAEEARQAEENARQAQMQAAYRGIVADIHGVCAKTPESYEAILDHGSEGLGRVYKALDAMYQELVSQGRDPGPPGPEDIAAAAEIVERVYRDEELAELRQRASRSRFKGRLILGEPPTTVAAPAKAPAASPSSPTTTLNNDLQGDAPQKRRLVSDEERIAAALLIDPPGKQG